MHLSSNDMGHASQSPEQCTVVATHLEKKIQNIILIIISSEERKERT